MARIVTLDGNNKEFQKALARSFQSGHVNFLFGSGASQPAISIAGQMEKEIANLINLNDEVEARNRMYDFLMGIQGPTNKLIANDNDENNANTLVNYRDCLAIIETILSERRTTLLPKQATIFTTNYDLFIEKASLDYPALKLNDGFSRVPSLDNKMEYSSRNFFDTTYNSGNLYHYKVEIPCINLVKLHGSLSWKKNAEEVVFSVEVKNLLSPEKTAEQIEKFINEYAIVLPLATKFRTTLVDRTYYELMRLYANELDRENTLLVTFGFSFGDEHILGITKRALKNPTLRLIAVAYNEADRDSFVKIFNGQRNVEIISPAADAQIDFSRFNELLRGALPKWGSNS